MMKNPFAGKSSRTKIFTIITVAVIVALLALNLFVTSYAIFGNAYIDLTPEGLYTLRPIMVDACREIFYTEDGSLREPGIKITFCDDPDNLISNTYTRVVYYMAVALAKEFENCEIETVNVKMNPTAVAEYKKTSLSQINPTDVIVSYGQRYRIVSADSFWRIGSDKVYSFDGEYKLASVLLSLTLVNRPKAYFVTDHGEDIYDAVNKENPINEKTGFLADMLMEQGFEILTLSLSETISSAEAAGKVPSIPEDCVLLIINNPKTDLLADESKFDSFYYVSETELLDRYMTEERGSIMVTKDYKVSLPELEDFLREWGIEYTDNRVKDSVNYLDNGTEEGTTIIADYNTDTESYAYAIYGDYADLATSPRMIIPDTGSIVSAFGDSTVKNEPGTANTSRVFAPFLYSSKNSNEYAKNSDNGLYVDPYGREGQRVVAAIGSRQKIDGETGNFAHSYIFAAASADFFSSDYLGNASYANYDIVSAMMKDIARLDTYADSSLGGTSANNGDSFLGKYLVDTDLKSETENVYEWDAEQKRYVVVDVIYGLSENAKIAYACVIAALPLAIAVTGIVICIKRKYL